MKQLESTSNSIRVSSWPTYLIQSKANSEV
jgi:hypothetical protein